MKYSLSYDVSTESHKIGCNYDSLRIVNTDLRKCYQLLHVSGQNDGMSLYKVYSFGDSLGRVSKEKATCANR